MAATVAKYDVFQAIADPTRREMLRLLSVEEKPLNVIVGHFPITRTAVAKHLRMLSEAGLVIERKSGRETRFSLNAEPLKELKSWLAFYEQFWHDGFDRLEKHLHKEVKKQKRRRWNDACFNT